MGDMATDEHGRPRPPQDGDEISTLLGFLEAQRATLEWKCQGLNDEQLRVVLPPSSVTLAGLLKHLAYVEDYWFSEVVGREQTPEPWASADTAADPDWEWTSAADDSADDLRALWGQRVERSRAIVKRQLQGSSAGAMAYVHPAWGGQGHVSFRWVLVHMIEEYARHNGHADLIRESIDGQTGE
ncbi:MAG: DinB family protein [Mycobacteriales bacterium]